MTASLLSVNIGRAHTQPGARGKPETTGIGKQPQTGPVRVRPPGPRRGGLGSGLEGDFIGDSQHHGGDDQAVYAVGREDLDRWVQRFERYLEPGTFGENLTTVGIDVNEALVGERWRVGDTVELVVTGPRIPCQTFQRWMDVPGWVKTYTADARPGAYLRVAVAGEIRAGDPITVLHRPTHEVTVSLAFRAMTTQRDLVETVATAGDDLSAELRDLVDRAREVADRRGSAVR